MEPKESTNNEVKHEKKVNDSIPQPEEELKTIVPPKVEHIEASAASKMEESKVQQQPVASKPKVVEEEDSSSGLSSSSSDGSGSDDSSDSEAEAGKPKSSKTHQTKNVSPEQ